LKTYSKKTRLSRRALFGTAAASVVFAPQVKSAIMGAGETEGTETVVGSAGVDRITILGARTYLHG